MKKMFIAKMKAQLLSEVEEKTYNGKTYYTAKVFFPGDEGRYEYMTCQAEDADKIHKGDVVDVEAVITPKNEEEVKVWVRIAK